MKLKLWLYVGYFVIFTFMFSQIAFPLSARISSINVMEADSSESLPVFNRLAANEVNSDSAHEFLIKDAVLTEAKNYHFLEYEVNVESTSFLPLDIIDSKLIIDDKYKDRVIIRLMEPYDKVVSTVKPSSKKFTLLVDTSLLSEDEIRDMVENITIHLNWRAIPGWERENRVYLTEGTLSF